jgi:hypothetical integral membrane protein (TIGR02206 family)
MVVLDPSFAGGFVMFGPAHLVTMLLTAVVWVALPLHLRRTGNAAARRRARYTLGGVLLGQGLLWTGWEAATGRFTWQLSLPLNLCDISSYLCVVMLLTGSFRLFEVLYFWALAGSIQSFVTPNVYYGFPHLEFIVFYVQHGGEILAILLLTVAGGMRPRAQSALKSYGYLVAYIAVVYLVNLALDANYMFLMADTPHPSMVSRMIALFGAPPRHVLGLGMVGALSVVLLYAPFALKDMALAARLRRGVAPV